MTKKPTVNVDKQEALALNAIGRRFLALKKNAGKLLMPCADIEAFAKTSDITKEHLEAWSKTCIFPYVGFLDYFYHIDSKTIAKHFFNQEKVQSIASSVELYWACLLWSLSPRLYRLDAKIEKVISADLSNIPIHTAVFERMPAWCVFLRLSNMTFNNRKVEGFFAYTDFLPEVGKTLNLVFVAENLGNFVVRLALDKNLTYSKAILDKEVDFDHWRQFTRRVGRFKDVAEAIPDRISQADRIAAVMIAVPRLLCLCADNADLYDLKLKSTVNREFLKSEKEMSHALRFNDANRPLSQVVVGSRIVVGANPNLTLTIKTATGEVVLHDQKAEKLSACGTLGTLPGFEETVSKIVAPTATAVQQTSCDTMSDLNRALETIANQKKQIDSMHQFIELLNKNNDALAKDLDESRCRYDELHEKFTESHRECDDLQQKIDAINRLQAVKHAEHDKLKAEVDEILEENAALRSQIGELDASIEPKKQRIEVLEGITQSLREKNDRLTQDVQKHAEESRKYLDLYLEASHKQEAAANEIAGLRKELAATEEHLQQTAGEITNLSNENARLRFAASSANKPVAQTAGVTDPQEVLRNRRILRKFFLAEELKPTESLELVTAFFAGQVTVLPSAWESAAQLDHGYQNGRELTKTLCMLVNDFLPEYLESGAGKARLVFGSKYSERESDSLVSNGKLLKERVFSGVLMQQHLRIGYSERLYFKVDATARKVVIGYCGNHLPIVSR